MAFPAKDGKMFHSAGRAKLHDDMAAPAAKAAPMKKPGGDGGMKHPAPSEQSIEEHVQEHGPAHKIDYHHDQGGTGKHHVTSHHGGGAAHEQHHSVHDSAEAAHEHMGQAMDVGPMKEEDDEQGSTESPDEAMAMKTGEGGGGGIPGLM